MNKPFGGTIYVTQDEYARLTSCMSLDDEVAAINLIGLDPETLAYKDWKLVVVEKVETRVKFADNTRGEYNVLSC